MSNDIYIFEVSENNFDDAVIYNSNQMPVLVEFMGVWSGPCIAMSDILADLAREFAGRFIFAKVDVDEQPELRKNHRIEHIPTLMVFKDETILRVEQGQMEEDDIRALLKDLGIFHESDAMREEARNKHFSGDTAGAIVLLTEAIKKDPKNTRVAMDMVQVFIDIQQLDNARELFNKLPEKDRNSPVGKSLNGQLSFAVLAAQTDGKTNLETKLQNNPQDHAARFDLALCLVAQHDYAGGLDNLLSIIQQKPDFKEGAAREMYVTIVNMLMPNAPELAQDYRRRLSNLLST